MLATRVAVVAAVLMGGSAAAVHSTDPVNQPVRLPQFGSAVALLGDQAFLGEPTSSDAPGGRVHVYRRVGNGWNAVTTLTAAGTEAGAMLGTSLAADGNTLLAGMRNVRDSSRGGVAVFSRGTNGGWTEAGTLGGTPAARSGFGAAVALSGDWAFVGAPRTAPGGAVHVFHRSGTTWSAAGTLPATTILAGDRFGTAISVDGDRIAVSAPGRDAQKGMIFVFRRSSDGSWTEESALTGRRVAANSQLGTSLLLRGDKLWAGGPNANGYVGTVVGFARGSSGAWTESRTLVPYESQTNRFGSSLAIVGDELWIGAPNSDSEGRIYRATFDDKGGITSFTKLRVDSLESGSGFGDNFVALGSIVAVGMPNSAGNEGSVVFLSRNAAGVWTRQSEVYPAVSQMTAITGAEKDCGTGGESEGYPCAGTSLLSFLPISDIGGRRGTKLSGNWGWTDPETGRDYALIGRTDGTSIVDVTDPVRPRYLGNLPKTEAARSSAWREMKTYRNYLLVVSDGAGPHGVQIFDLTRLRGVTTPRTWEVDALYDQVANVHDILANDSSGYAYAVGTNGGGESCGGGYHIIDMHNPLEPKFAGCFSDTSTGRMGTGYSHDAICVIYHGPDEQYHGREICVGSNETAMSITDLTDKNDMKVLSRATYPDVAYAHQGWWTEDQRYFYVNDELDEVGGVGEAGKATRTLIFDFADLDDPVLVKQFLGTTKASDHNLYVRGNRMYQSNYKAGLRILDVGDPVNPREVGYFDVAPGDDSPGFEGAWNNYPFFRNGAILVSSIENGIYMVRDRTQAVP